MGHTVRRGRGLSQLFPDSNGKITPLPLPSFASASRATGCSTTAINDNGQIVATSGGHTVLLTPN